MSRLRYGLAACACALLVLPAAASARPGQRSFDQTYPVASKLCTNIANGQGPTKLRADKTLIAGLCTTLESSFTTTQNTYFTTVTPLKQQAIAVNATTREACATRPSTTCSTARAQDRMTLKGLHAQVLTAGTTYRTSIQAARKTFWNAIHALRGGAGITPDTSATVIAPTTTLPAAIAL
jgi:hypothetical protein